MVLACFKKSILLLPIPLVQQNLKNYVEQVVSDVLYLYISYISSVFHGLHREGSLIVDIKFLFLKLAPLLVQHGGVPPPP